MRSFRALLGPAIVTATALSTFGALVATPGADPVLAAPTFHFWLVSATAVLTLGLATVVAAVGTTVRDARILYLGAGLMGLAGFFALHGLATPGFLIGSNAVVSVASQAATASLAAWLVVAALHRPAADARRSVVTLATWSAFVLLAIIVGLLRPEWARFVPVHQDPLRWAATAVVLGLLGVAGARFHQGYRLSRSPLSLVMLYVVGLVAAAQIVMVAGETFRLSWWLYHLLLLIAVVAMLAASLRLVQAGRFRSGLGTLLDADPERHLRFGLRPEVRALVVATEAKDPYTAGHMQRVARDAVRLGRRLGLDADDLRVLAQAGTVHDVGKLDVPDAILNKPGRLDEAEFARVREHPVVGARIAHDLGMHRRELEVVRHHHERWDGSGYPDGLAGTAIPRLARVLSVADVYDAVTSERAYREPMRDDEARELIASESGVAFDPELVHAFLALADRAEANGARRDERRA